MERFLSLLRDVSPRFVCRAAGRQEPKPPPITVGISHEVGTAATDSQLTELARLNAESLAQFWSLHNGAALFIGPIMPPVGIAAAFRLYACSEIASKTDKMRQRAVGGREGLYTFQKKGVAFGEVCFSGNCFVIHDGGVFHSNHDGGDDRPFAASLSLFLDRVAADPAKFLYDAGCYTRYSDGVTKTQWIPETYLSAAASPS